MTIFDDAKAIRDDFAGCDERTIQRVRDFLLADVPAARRVSTTVTIKRPYSVRPNVVVIDAVVTREGVVDEIEFVITDDLRHHAF